MEKDINGEHDGIPNSTINEVVNDSLKKTNRKRKINVIKMILDQFMDLIQHIIQNNNECVS